jgi:hypothetical protein
MDLELFALVCNAAEAGLLDANDMGVQTLPGSIAGLKTACEGLIEGNTAAGGKQISEDKREPIQQLYNATKTAIDNISEKIASLTEKTRQCTELQNEVEKLQGEVRSAKRSVERRKQHPITFKIVTWLDKIFSGLVGKVFGECAVGGFLFSVCQDILRGHFGSDFNLQNATEEQLGQVPDVLTKGLKAHKLEQGREVMRSVCDILIGLTTDPNIKIQTASAEFASSGGDDARDMSVRQPVRGVMEGLLGIHGHSGTPEERKEAKKQAIEQFAGTYGRDVCKRMLDGLAAIADAKAEHGACTASEIEELQQHDAIRETT